MILTKAAGIFFVTISSFPWVGFSNFDTQPFPFIIAILYLLLEFLVNPIRFSFQREIFISGTLILIGVIFSLFLASDLNFLAFRGIVMYLGIPIYIFAFTLFIKKYGFPTFTIYFCNLIWIFFAIFQLFYPDLFSTFFSIRTTENRGLTSLAPEPTFFGIYLFFSSWILAASEEYNLSKYTKYLIILNIGAIIFLAMSSMAILFVILAALTIYAYSPSRIHKRYLIKIILILISIILIINNFFESTRFFSLINLVFSNPELIFKIDASSNSRLSSIIIPINAFIQNYFIPQGFYAYPKVAEEIASYYGDFFFYEYNKNKIESWFGSIIFELGIFGLIGVIVVFYSLKGCSRKPLFESLFLFVILLTAIPVAFPFTYLLITLLLIGINKNNQ